MWWIDRTKIIWASGWCLTPAIFQLHHGENKLHLMRWCRCPLCTRLTHLVGLLVLAYWNNSLLVDMPIHSDKSSCLCSYSWMLHAQQRSNKYQFYSLWFDLTLTPMIFRSQDKLIWPGLTPMIFRSQDKLIWPGLTPMIFRSQDKLIWPGLTPMIFRSQDKHANHYPTYAVQK